MLYSCEDIKRILSDNAADVDIEAFDKHLAGCSECAGLCELDDELEQALRVSLPHSTPEGFGSKLLTKLRVIEKEFASTVNSESLIPYAIVVAILIVFANIKTVRDFFRGVFDQIDFPSIIQGVTATLDKIPRPGPLVESLVNESPLILFGLISIAALIWIFSILEFEKSVK